MNFYKVHSLLRDCIGLRTFNLEAWGGQRSHKGGMEYRNKILKPLGNQKYAVLKKEAKTRQHDHKTFNHFFRNLLFQIQLSLTNVSVINY